MDFTKGTKLSPNLSNNHSGFSVFYIYSKYNIGAICPSYDVFYMRIRAALRWKNFLPHINFRKTTLVRCSV